MDVLAVMDAARTAVDHARSGNGPYFLDCRCYRFVGHHTAERTMNLTYRTTEEVESWMNRDPLVVAARHALEAGEQTAVLEAEDVAVGAQLAGALELARAGAVPDPASALEYGYASPTAVRWGRA